MCNNTAKTLEKYRFIRASLSKIETQTPAFVIVRLFELPPSGGRSLEIVNHMRLGPPENAEAFCVQS